MFMNERQKMLSGQPFDPSDPELVADRIANERWLARLNATLGWPPDARRDLLIERFDHVGAGVDVAPPFTCTYGYNIEVGAGATIQSGVLMQDACRIEIGERTQIGPGVIIASLTAGPLTASGQRLHLGHPIAIGRDVWIGAGARILAGSVVPDGTEIAPGSIVSPG